MPCSHASCSLPVQWLEPLHTRLSSHCHALALLLRTQGGQEQAEEVAKLKQQVARLEGELAAARASSLPVQVSRCLHVRVFLFVLALAVEGWSMWHGCALASPGAIVACGMLHAA